MPAQPWSNARRISPGRLSFVCRGASLKAEHLVARGI